MIGRTKECQSVKELLDAVRAGHSRVLVVRGEPGIGKSALLQYLIDAAAGFRVIHATGVQSEMELPFAALHQLCSSLLDNLHMLPDPQRAAASTAFGLTTGGSPDRLLMGLAVLNLLSAASDEAPLLGVVDDAQWLDRASAQALAFVARRPLDRVGLVFATRHSSADFDEFPEVVVDGLHFGDARMLLSEVLRVPLDERVRDRIVAETHGNPLLLVEWPRDMTPAELAGGFGIPALMPMSGLIEEQGFRRRIAELPAPTQGFLLVAAADAVGDPVRVLHAADLLDIDGDAAYPAIGAGLLELGTTVVFRHPLVRSAAYRAADELDRRRAHRALAEATDPDVDPDRRAWHRAQAAAGPDEGVALELERSAACAQRRGGLAAAAAFLERSVELTAESARRFERLVKAAEAKHYAGEIEGALRLLALAEAAPLDSLGRARVSLLRGRMAFLSDNGSDAPRLLLKAAREVESRDSGLASEIYRMAMSAANAAGGLARVVGVPAVASAARARPPALGGASDVVLEGLALFDTEGPALAAPTLAQAVKAFRSPDLPPQDAAWLNLAGAAASLLWDQDSWHVLASIDLQRARDAGALTTLPHALNGVACVHLFGGDLEVAASLFTEAENIVEATGSQYVRYGALHLEALRGREAEALVEIEVAIKTATTNGQGIILPYARSAAATLYNGLARYDEALTAAREANTYPRHWGSHLTLHELVEAAVRTGSPETGADAFEWLSETAVASGTDWGLGVRARSQALLTEGDEAEMLYREAIDRLGRPRLRTELARAYLLYGEWLRRQNRRVQAREQLRVAYDMLSTMGMEGFAERARRELLTTGVTVRKSTANGSDELTQREVHIARLAADGRTNPEIGARLFISPRTVEWHLHKVFTKLAVTSRRQLREGLGRSIARMPADVAVPGGLTPGHSERS